MENTKSNCTCLNCNRSENEVPLVALQYAQNPRWICTQCLPMLIHQPQQLVGKLAGAEKLTPVAPQQE